MAGFKLAVSGLRAPARAGSQFQLADTLEVGVDQITSFSGSEE